MAGVRARFVQLGGLGSLVWLAMVSLQDPLGKEGAVVPTWMLAPALGVAIVLLGLAWIAAWPRLAPPAPRAARAAAAVAGVGLLLVGAAAAVGESAGALEFVLLILGLAMVVTGASLLGVIDARHRYLSSWERAAVRVPGILFAVGLGLTFAGGMGPTRVGLWLVLASVPLGWLALAVGAFVDSGRRGPAEDTALASGQGADNGAL